MPQSIDIKLYKSRQILCQYKNQTSQIQIVRLLYTPFHALERIINPNEIVNFNALPESFLEISSLNSITTLIDEILSCENLQILDEL